MDTLPEGNVSISSVQFLHALLVQKIFWTKGVETNESCFLYAVHITIKLTIFEIIIQKEADIPEVWV